MAIPKLIRTAIKNPAYTSVATYIFTNFFSKGVSFLLIPLFTNPKYLTPTDNGLLSLFSSNMMLLTPFICLGMVQSSNIDFFKKNKEDFSASFTSNFIIGIFFALFATTILFLFKDILQRKFEFPPSFVYVIPILVFLVFCSEQLFALVRNRNEVRNYAIFGISKTLIEYTVSVILIVFFLKGWYGRVWGIAISLIAINLIAFYYYSRNSYLTFNIKRNHILEEIKFGAPVIAFQICVFMLGSTNKLFLAIFNVDKHQLGIYAVACLFGTIVGTIGQSILLYAQPKLYKSISSGEATTQSLLKGFYSFFKMLSFLTIPCILVVFFLYYFVIDKVYITGIPFFLIVTISSFIWCLNNYIFLFLLYHKAKRKILLLSLLSISCSLIVNILMVKNFLIIGDAFAGLINTVIFGVMVVIITAKIMAAKHGDNALAEKKLVTNT